MSTENNESIPCKICSKPISPKADYCSYCGAPQKKKSQKDELPGYLKLVMLNLFCPGYGDWALGAKLRGAIFFLIVLVALGGYCSEVFMGFYNAVNLASSGNLNALEKMESALNSKANFWPIIFILGYILSFVDSFFLRMNKQKKMEQEGKNEFA